MLVCHGGPHGTPVGFEGRVFNRGDQVNADGTEAALEKAIRADSHAMRNFTPAVHQDDNSPYVKPLQTFPVFHDDQHE